MFDNIFVFLDLPSCCHFWGLVVSCVLVGFLSLLGLLGFRVCCVSGLLCFFLVSGCCALDFLGVLGFLVSCFGGLSSRNLVLNWG